MKSVEQSEWIKFVATQKKGTENMERKLHPGKTKAEATNFQISHRVSVVKLKENLLWMKDFLQYWLINLFPLFIDDNIGSSQVKATDENWRRKKKSSASSSPAGKTFIPFLELFKSLKKENDML